MRRQAVRNLHARDGEKYPVETLCRLLGMSKQAYYQYDEDKALARAARETFALEYIRSVRSEDHGIGGQLLYVMYRRDFAQSGDIIGRDAFYRIMDENGLKVRKKPRAPKTTDSTHGLPTYPNIVKDLIPTFPNQLWVSDITYIKIWSDDYNYKFCYLSLILDAYTEEIVGWSVKPTLTTDGPVKALNMALKRLEDVPAEDVHLIHHSDRGIQYVSKEYVKILLGHGISISMTETGNPKDNPQAERINNTMKNELLKDIVFHDISEVITAVSNAVIFYNTKRPHMSLNYMTPAEAAACSGERTKRWRSYREEAIKRTRQEKNVSQTKDISEKSVPLHSCQGSPSGYAPQSTPDRNKI